MSIDQIKGNNYSSRPAKSNSSAKANNANKSDVNAPKDASNNTKQADSLFLSGSKFANEVEFTKNLLRNTRKDSLASLKAVKKKIDAGAYDNEAVHKEIGALIDEELSMLQHILNQPPEENDTGSTISTEHKERLLQNPKVTQKIAEEIAKYLQNI